MWQNTWMNAQQLVNNGYNPVQAVYGMMQPQAFPHNLIPGMYYQQAQSLAQQQQQQQHQQQHQQQQQQSGLAQLGNSQPRDAQPAEALQEDPPRAGNQLKSTPRRPAVTASSVFSSPEIAHNETDSSGYSSQVHSAASHSFQRVPGRLTVLHSRFFDVSREEIVRRISGPEKFNRTTLSAFLRRGKQKGCGEDFVAELRKYGIALSQNVKKEFITTFSGFFEDEAIQMGEDHRRILKESFPIKSLTKIMVARKFDLTSHKLRMHALKLFMEELLNFYKVATANSDKATFKEAIHDSESPFMQFALQSHCFGVIEFKNYAMLILEYAEVGEDECDKEQDKLIMNRDRQSEEDIVRATDPNYHLQDYTAVIEPDFQPEKRIYTKYFQEVPARLILSNTKYGVTQAEIRRRLAFPECLNASVLGSILRMAKTSEKAKELRDKLQQRGIQLPSGKRKVSPLTTFTALIEEEATRMAKDMTSMCENQNTIKAIAFRLHQISASSNPILIRDRAQMLRAAQGCLEELYELLHSIELPICRRVPGQQSLLQPLLAPYCQLTHGFGPTETLNFVNFFHRIAEETSKHVVIF